VKHLWMELRTLAKGAMDLLFHSVVIALSAGIALSLPLAASFLGREFLGYWSQIENDKVALVTIEVAVAVLLIACSNYLRRSIRDRKLAEMAAHTGFAYFFPNRNRLAESRIKKLKYTHGLVRNIMLIGSTGYRTFVDPKGDLHSVLKNCMEGKILLLNPHSDTARARARALGHWAGGNEYFLEQVAKSITFLKQLRTAQKSIKLKLYADPPHVKLAILGDYIWLQNYHPSRDAHSMPEYVFHHNQDELGLYPLFYQYFIKRWESPEIPEYDFETDELVFRDSAGNVVARKSFSLDEEKRGAAVLN
jgi:hypothetical protein